MTRQEIVEYNKKCAEFMGVFDKILSTGNIHSWSDAPFYYTTEDTKEKVIKNICKYSKYDSDWNWLMEVVEKINNTKDEWGNSYTLQIGNGFVWVDPHIGDRIFYSGSDIGYRDESIKNKVVRAIDTFLNYYNKNYDTNGNKRI